MNLNPYNIPGVSERSRLSLVCGWQGQRPHYSFEDTFLPLSLSGSNGAGPAPGCRPRL